MPFSIILSVVFSVGTHTLVSATQGSMGYVLLAYVPLAVLEGLLIGLVAGVASYLVGSLVSRAGNQRLRHLLQALASAAVSGLSYNLVWHGFWRPGPPIPLVILSGIMVFGATLAYLWRFEAPSHGQE